MCSTVFASKAGIKGHLKLKHTPSLSFPCPICDEKFKSKQQQLLHLAKVHAMDEIKVKGRRVLQKSKTRACSTCGKEFKTELQLNQHSRAHKLFDCNECSRQFSRHKLAVHRADEHGVPMPTCGVCGYRGTSKAKVVTHQRNVHMKEKDIPCPHCEMKFFGVQHLNRHMIKHNPVRKYECKFCKKTFPRLNTLRFHERIHTGEKNKVCPVCDERFVQRASLKYHMTKHHPEVN